MTLTNVTGLSSASLSAVASSIATSSGVPARAVSVTVNDTVVRSTCSLSNFTFASWTPAAESAFTAGLAASLNVSAAAIELGTPVAVSATAGRHLLSADERSRRGLLQASGLLIPFGVHTGPDPSASAAVSRSIQTSSQSGQTALTAAFVAAGLPAPAASLSPPANSSLILNVVVSVTSLTSANASASAVASSAPGVQAVLGTSGIPLTLAYVTLPQLSLSPSPPPVPSPPPLQPAVPLAPGAPMSPSRPSPPASPSAYAAARASALPHWLPDAAAGAAGGVLLLCAIVALDRCVRRRIAAAPGDDGGLKAGGSAPQAHAKGLPRRRALLLEAAAAKHMDTHPRADKASKAAKTPRADAKLVAAEDSPQQPHRPPPQEAWAAPLPPTRRASLDYDSRPKAPPSAPGEVEVELLRPPREPGVLGKLQGSEADAPVPFYAKGSVREASVKGGWVEQAEGYRRPRPPDTWGLAPRSRHRRVLSSGAMEAMDLGEDFPTYGEPVKAYHATGGARWDADDQLVYGRSYAVYDSSRAALASPSSKPVARGKRDTELFTFD